MRRYVVITKEALDAIRAAAVNEYSSEAIRNEDGSYAVPLSPETIARVNEHMLDDETFSDCLIRVIALSKGKAN